MNVLCPYCGCEAEFVDSARVYRGKSYGMIYDCRPCDAYVGVHKGTDKPLGTLANRELRQMRMRAHAAFDPMWKRGTMSRRDAYGWMQRTFGMTAEQAHISRFGVAECERLLVAINGSKPVRQSAPVFTECRDFRLLGCCEHIAPWEHCEHTLGAESV